jgi:Rrf2 family protein
VRLELSKKTDLAISAIRHLCGVADGEYASGADLSTAIGTSTNFLPQIMTPLVRNYWVESAPGRSGGYRLNVEPREISLLSLIEAVEGPTVNGRCVLRGAPCPVAEPCALHDPWTRARDALLSELASTPLTEIGCRARPEEGSDVEEIRLERGS